MRYYIVLLCVFMSGCITLSGKQDFPDVPPVLLAKCPELNTINKPTVLLSELMKTVTNNYTKYHDCAASVEAWQQWYEQQRKNAEEE